MVYRSPTKPWKHQAEYPRRLQRRPVGKVDADVFALLCEMGTGKSKMILDEWGQRVDAGELQNLLVVAPAGSYRNWFEGKTATQKSELDAQLDPALRERIAVAPWISGARKSDTERLERMLRSSRPRVLVVNVEALSTVEKARAACRELLESGPTMMVVDECFTGDMRVSTPWGYTPIESLRDGDIVNTGCGSGRIRRVLRKHSSALAHLHMSDGSVLHTTPNHPFFTDQGWVCAGLLEGRRVYGREEVRNLRGAVLHEKAKGVCEVLWAILFSEMEDAATRSPGQVVQPSGESQDLSNLDCDGVQQERDILEQGRPDARRDTCEIECATARDRSSTEGTWWQRSRYDGPTENASCRIRLALETGARHTIGRTAARLSNLLQGRSGGREQEAGDRVRWEHTLWTAGQETRCQERREATGTWVVRVEVEQLEHPADVFDLELEGTPHYFVENVLVHNSTRIKGDSSRTEAAQKLGELAVSRRIMSGLVAPRDPLDLFHQYWFLDWRILGHRSFWSYRARYAVMQKMMMRGKMRDIVVGFRNQEELQERISPWSYRVLLEECLDMPGQTYQFHDVELTPVQRRMIRELLESATTQLSDGVHVTKTIMLSILNEIDKILLGWTTDEEGRVHAVPTNRYRELAEVLGDHSGKAIIWTSFQQSVEATASMLREEYGEKSVAVFYGPNKSTRHLDEQRFLSDPECRFMVSTPAAGGVGNTWNVATLRVYLNNSHDLEHRLQSEKRNYRGGQTRPVTSVDLVCRECRPELRKIQALRDKIDISSLISGDGAREWLIP